MPALVIGELHIPYRSPGISDKVKTALQKETISSVFCTGNLCTWNVSKQIKELAEETYIVKGSADYYSRTDNTLEINKTSNLVFNYEGYVIGLISDTCTFPVCDPLMLSILAESLNVDILLFGGCPTFQAFNYQNRLFLSPGSATGAFESRLLNYEPSSQSTTQPPTSTYKCVEVVDHVDPAIPNSQESILTYKFPVHRELQFPSYLLLDLGSGKEFGNIKIRLNVLVNNQLHTETIIHNMDPDIILKRCT